MDFYAWERLARCSVAGVFTFCITGYSLSSQAGYISTLCFKSKVINRVIIYNSMDILNDSTTSIQDSQHLCSRNVETQRSSIIRLIIQPYSALHSPTRVPHLSAAQLDIQRHGSLRYLD